MSPSLHRDKDAAKQIKLRRAEDTRAIVGELDKSLPKARVRDVVDDGNHSCELTRKERPFPGLSARAQWPEDKGGANWTPQGISGSADARGSGTYDDRQIVLVTWYDDRDDGQGARVTFVDLSAGSTALTYRHVILVEPYKDDFREFAHLHAGGCVWYGNLLYVAATDRIRVFDLDHLWNIEDRDLGYKYALPQVFTYESTGVRCSFLSLDRGTTPDSIIVGEWNSEDDARLTRWKIDFTSRELVYDTGGETATADDAYVTNGIRSMQGAVSVGGTFYVTCTNHDHHENGHFYELVPDGAANHYSVDLVGPEDLYHDATTNSLWTLNEATSHGEFGRIDLGGR